MSMKINHELPLPEVLKSQYPLSQELKEVKKQRDEDVYKRQVLYLLFCSFYIHNVNPFLLNTSYFYSVFHFIDIRVRKYFFPNLISTNCSLHYLFGLSKSSSSKISFMAHTGTSTSL